MSRTFSSWTRERSANGYARRTSSCSSSTAISSCDAIPTTCCARTSSGLRGICVSSIAPSFIFFTTTADSSRSARNFGKTRPRETDARSWPARPTRCSPRATDFGDSTWITRSTAPMSIPSSSEEVATRQGIWPRFRGCAGFAGAAADRSELVEPERQSLGETAIVDEDDRGAVLLDELDDLGVDGRPDRLRRGLAAGPEDVGDLRVHPRLAHILERHYHLEVELLRPAGVNELDRPSAGDELPDLLQRPLGRRQPDPLEGLARQALEPLDGQREMRPPLRPRDGMNLVEDQRAHPGQRLARARGEHEEERLRRRDQQVRRIAQHRRPLLLRRVPRAHRNPHVRLQTGE